MSTYAAPLIDENPGNPFYCPGLPATSYVDALRRRLNTKFGPARKISSPFRGDRLLYSFASILDKALVVEDGESDFLHQDSDRLGLSSQLSSLTQEPCSVLASNDDTLASNCVKRKRSPSVCSFSDINQPPKHARSLLSSHDSSFEVTVKHEALDYFGPNTGHSPFERRIPKGRDTLSTKLNPSVRDLNLRIQALEDELYGPPIGAESPGNIKHLISRLDSLLPGIRLEARLLALDRPTHQKIANVLADNGLLNARVLQAFRASEIRSLSLSASLIDQDGLNISGSDSLRVFSAPNSFLFLSELCFSGTPIKDLDLTYIHHLPRLVTLLLDNTCIGNEAIYLLTSLKRTLARLSLSANPRIDDAAVPALLLLSKLSSLNIYDTRIGMDGLRLFASTFSRLNRMIDIDVPSSCSQYLDTIHLRYLIDPVPPLIVDPDLCSQLSLGALERNLAQHATCNSGILTTGKKPEMVKRLEKILKTRKMDLLVMDMVWGNVASSSDSDSSEIL